MNAIRPTRAVATAPVAARASLLPMAGLGAAIGAALLADLLEPVLPALRLLALLAAAGFGLALALPVGWARGMAVLAIGLGGLALLQALAAQPNGLLAAEPRGLVAAEPRGLVAAEPRGLLAGRMEVVARLQDRLLRLPPRPWDADRLRAALALPGAAPRPAPATADEALFNALLLHARRDRAAAAAALAEALRLDPAPRPDALLLHVDLARQGTATPGLPAPLAALLHALALPEAAARAAALVPLVVAEPEDLVAAAALAHARIEAALPRGLTIAEAGAIAAALAPFADPERRAAFEASFLDPRRAAALRQGVAALDWVRDLAGQRLQVEALLPPPGLPDQPALLRLAAPEPARAVQVRRGGGWVTVEAGPADALPTLRLPRPFRPGTIRLRYLDRDGTASAEIAYGFDPAAELRLQARRSLARQGPFALYQPGWLEAGRLNPLPIPGHLRSGLAAIEWRTDAEPMPRRSPVGVGEAELLAGDPARILVEFAVPETARLLVLRAILADGTEGEPAELAIR
jgi:hypothetical protein